MDERRPSQNAATLTRMAEQKFGSDLTQAERKMLAAVTTRRFAYCGPSEDDDNENEPEAAVEWSHQRSIRAELIRWLCAERRAREFVDPRGIQVHAAKIIGSLNLQSLVVPFPVALVMCALTGPASLNSLDISELVLRGSWVRALSAGSMRVRGSLFLTRGFHADGEVQLIDAQIGAQLNCIGGEFINPAKKDVRGSGIAFEADGISVGGSLLLREGFRAEGQVVLINAKVGGNLHCDGKFINPAQKDVRGSGVALNAYNVSSKGSAILRAHFEGEVLLMGAQFGSSLDCNHGEFISPAKRALCLDRATIAGDALLGEGFRAEGKVSLIGSRIERELNCDGAGFAKAQLWLEGGSAESIRDLDSHWPERGNLHLDGFVYRRAYPLNASSRLQWLELQPENPFFPQPYLQLSKVLAEAGDEAGRIKVLVAMQDQEWAVRRRGLAAQLWRWPFRITVGYGYRPLLALWEILGLSTLGWIIYRRSYLAGGIVPRDKDAYQEFKTSGGSPNYHTRFSPSIYSVENSLPLVKLGQAEKWQPDPSPDVQPASPVGKPSLGRPCLWPRRLRWLQNALVFIGLLTPQTNAAPRSGVSRWGTSSRFLRWFLWIQILLGWLLATLFLAGISGIIKRE